MKYSKKDGQVRLETKQTMYIGFAIWSCGMSIPGFVILFSMILEPTFDQLDLIGTAFILVWLGIVFRGAAIFASMAGQIMIIDSEGVSVKTKLSLLKPIYLTWEEIADYGYVLHGKINNENDSDSYMLYFARNVLPIRKLKKTKKVERSEIRFSFGNDGIRVVTDYVLPFCSNYANCKAYGVNLDIETE